MARETRKKKTKLPASSAHRTEPVLKLRLERKEHPSDPEAIPFRTPQERIAATRLSLSFWDQYLKRMETGFAGIHSRFAAFERGARKDLEALACEGANPNVIMNIFFTVWVEEPFERARLEAGELSSLQEIRRLSSKRRWANVRASLERTRRLLSELLS